MNDAAQKHVAELSSESENRNFLAAQWLRLYVSTAGGLGSIRDQGTMVPCCVVMGEGWVEMNLGIPS